jgi:hypothetical protein
MYTYKLKYNHFMYMYKLKQYNHFMYMYMLR